MGRPRKLVNPDTEIEPIADVESQEVMVSDKVVDILPISTAEIKERVAQLKAEHNKEDIEARIKGLLNQLPKGPNAKALGVSCMDYAIRVMASQSPDPNVAPALMCIAKTQRALKNQGYGTSEIAVVIDALDKAYGV